MKVSLVVPAYNEEKLLPRLLDTIDIARGRYSGAVEVIVADNMSTDNTAAIARQRGCTVVSVEKRRIGAARNGGAASASGEIISFVDADMRVHPEIFNAIEAALANPRIIGGASGVTPERWSLGFAATYALLVPMVVATGMDTGVVFCRREDFDAVRGYDDELLLAEDVDFLWKLKRRGWKQRQKLVRLRRYKAIASLRKFDEFGEWHYFPLIWRGLAARGKRMQEFADLYWYRPRR